MKNYFFSSIWRMMMATYKQKIVRASRRRGINENAKKTAQHTKNVHTQHTYTQMQWTNEVIKIVKRV